MDTLYNHEFDQEITKDNFIFEFGQEAYDTVESDGNYYEWRFGTREEYEQN